MSAHHQLSGVVALTICESLLLALEEREILDKQEVRDLLMDAAAAHGNEVMTANDPKMHLGAQAIIDRLLKQKGHPRPLGH